MRQLISAYLTPTLKTISIFEDFNERLGVVLYPGPGETDRRAIRTIEPKLGEAFALRSLDLEQLSVSYSIDARDFFRAGALTRTWPNLQCLALTSQLLRSTISRAEIDTLLYQAGIRALRMPRLRPLVIWHGIKGNACAFIYRDDRAHASITWRGTWEMKLSARVVEVWQHVAFEGHPYALWVCQEQVCRAIQNHGDAIHYLNLPCQVIHPESLWQIRREGACEIRKGA